MIGLTKSYALLRLMNSSPGPVVRWCLAGVGGAAALVFTGNRVIAADIRHSLKSDTNLKSSLRRLAWYGARSKLRIEPVNDPVFDFAQGCDPDVLAAQTAFISKRRMGGVQQ